MSSELINKSVQLGNFPEFSVNEVPLFFFLMEVIEILILYFSSWFSIGKFCTNICYLKKIIKTSRKSK